jgi:hypothetical protein
MEWYPGFVGYSINTSNNLYFWYCYILFLCFILFFFFLLFMLWIGHLFFLKSKFVKFFLVLYNFKGFYPICLLWSLGSHIFQYNFLNIYTNNDWLNNNDITLFYDLNKLILWIFFNTLEILIDFKLISN